MRLPLRLVDERASPAAWSTCATASAPGPAVPGPRAYARAVPDLPLFPLGTVLFPGLVLPLHVFEDRYRVLIAELLARPEPEQRFGVVAIREGRETGIDGVHALYDVGCAAQLQTADRHPDGRYDLVTVGADRFRLTALRGGRPYLLGEVEWLPDEVGPTAEAQLLARAVRSAFAGYLDALAEASGAQVEAPELPDEPLLLSHLVAATVQIDLADRQALLAEPDARSRLRAELALLRREQVLLRTLSALPSPSLARGQVSAN